MVVLMVVEGLVNHFHRRREQDLADSLTRCWSRSSRKSRIPPSLPSISMGLLMTLVGLLTRLRMVEVYQQVYSDYRLVSRWRSRWSSKGRSRGGLRSRS